jgi:polyisoprenoid-binding protein YceI
MTAKQSRTLLFLLPTLLLVALLIWACSGAANQTAAPAAQEQATTAPAEPAATVTTPPVAESAAMTETEATETEAAEAEAAQAEPTGTESADTAVTVQRFVIDQSQSAARFTLDEELMGAPKTVVGTTSLVNGEITVDLADMTKTTLSAIQIDARDFTTDSSRRDGAIQRFVLGSTSDDNRYIVFTPTSIEGLPSTAQVGDSFELQITGDLTISGVTKPVTFATTVTVDSDTQLTGLAKAQVLRSDYNLTIPSVPSVANVTDEVQLELQFVAIAA